MKFKRKSKTVSTKHNSNAPSVTFITKDTEIKANMHCNDDVRIAGFIKGEVKSKKKFILTESGKLEGTVISSEADISGKVKGDVRSIEKLTLRSTAVIDGEILTKTITIENGAQIKGSLQVGPDVNVEKNGTQKTAGSPTSLKDSSKERESSTKTTEDEASKDNPEKGISGSSKLSA